MKNLGTDPKLILIKIRRFEQFKEIAKCVQLVAMTALHSCKADISNRYNSLVIIKKLLNFRMEQAKLHYDESDRHSYLLVFITSDKTSCGAMNSNMLNEVRYTIEDIQESLDTVSVISIGRKGTYLLSKVYKSVIAGTFRYLEKEVLSFHIAYSIAFSFFYIKYDSLLFYFTSFVDTFDHKLAQVHIPCFSLFF
jgi:F0F1-type ATP synthase gamma subunit